MSQSLTALSEHNPGEKPTTARFEVLGLLAMAAMIAYLARNSLGVAESTIRDDMHLSLSQSGWFMGAFFWSYAVLQIPSGWLAQRYGTRRMLTLFAIGWSAAVLCIGSAPAFWILIAANLLMGAAQAGIFPSACYSISHWIPQARRSSACGILSAGMQVGAIMVAVVTGPLIADIGWRRAFMIYAIPGFLWALVFMSRFRDQPADDATVNDMERELIQSGARRPNASASNRGPTPWMAMAWSRTVWFLCLQQMCRSAGYIFFATWFPTFLQKARNMTVSDSGYLQALVLGGTLVGSFGGGLVTDWILRRTGNLKLSRSGVGAGCLLVCALLILAAWFVKDVTAAVALLAGGAFFAALAGPSAYVVTIDIGGGHVPQVFGLMNMMGNLAAAACPIVVGELFERTDNWDLALLMFAGLYLTGAICWLFVDPRQKIDA
jgi:ACS family D-galactonate transporter-like MFS transporter